MALKARTHLKLFLAPSLLGTSFHSASPRVSPSGTLSCICFSLTFCVLGSQRFCFRFHSQGTSFSVPDSSCQLISVKCCKTAECHLQEADSTSAVGPVPKPRSLEPSTNMLYIDKNDTWEILCSS